MTIGQKRLTTLLFTSVIAISTANAQTTPGNSNVILNSPSTNSVPNSTPPGIAAPATAPTPATTTTVTPANPAASTTTVISKSTTATTTTPKTVVAPNPSAPMDQPNMSDADVLNWTTQAAQLAYTYDFKNYPKQIPMLQDHFTPEGWKAFSAALTKSNNLNVVQNRKLVASAVPTGKAVVVKEGVKNGLFTWRIQIPMMATYESESRLIKQNLLVNILVTRSNNAQGIGISHFVAQIVPANLPITNNTNLTQNAITGSAPTSIYTQPATTTPATTTSPSIDTNTMGTTPASSGTDTTAAPSTVPSSAATPTRPAGVSGTGAINPTAPTPASGY
jgi:hypothetical protein